MIVSWCKEMAAAGKGSWWPAIGRGHTQSGFGGVKRSYTAPKRKGGSVLAVGEQYHVVRLASGNLIIEHNVDWEKLFVHRRMSQPHDEPGAITLFIPSDSREHLDYLKQITSEQLVEKDGETKWIKERKDNHYLDATILALLAARKAGVSTLLEAPKPPRPSAKQAPVVLVEGKSRINMKY
jgi:hypothetical protein